MYTLYYVYELQNTNLNFITLGVGNNIHSCRLKRGKDLRSVSNSQATLHPCIYYYSCDGKELQHGSLFFISECNIHDTVAVHLFQRQLVEYLKSTYGVITKITYFSDGCAGQYKNCKNFINLCYHLEDFGVPAEWHFFATSHGKGPCDGVGGTVKRQAAKASLQRVYTDQITTPHGVLYIAGVKVST